ncbi:MAG: dimethylsulfonioproprionate lyase family protein [Pseudomonadota bacterium]
MNSQSAHSLLWNACLDAIGWFADLAEIAPNLRKAPVFHPVKPVPLAPGADLEHLRDVSLPELLPLVDAVIAAAPYLHWRQSYSLKDGVAPEFLNAYGYVSFGGPEDAVRLKDRRIFVGYFGEGVEYPPHAHAAEEVYGVIAGEAVFHRLRSLPTRVFPGDTVCFDPWRVHSIDMTPGPLLVLAIWKGQGLGEKPSMSLEAGSP